MTLKRKRITKNHRIVYTFLLTESICYFIFLYLDISQYTDNGLVQASLWLKWFSVVLCFAFVALHKSAKYRKKEKNIVSTALFLTVAADFFLLLTNQSTAGVLCFVVVQTLYLYRLTMWNDEISFISRIIQRILCGLGVFLFSLLLAGSGNMGLFAVSFYFVSLIDNIMVVASLYFYHVGSKRKPGCFFAGLCLLFLCDIQVGIYNMEMYIPVREGSILSKCVAVAAVAMWLFYLPSQILIALSGRLEK